MARHRSPTDLLRVATLILPCVTIACSGNEESDSSQECTSLRPGGAIVDQVIDYGGSPAPAIGGEIADGTYTLSAATAYVPSGSVVLLDCDGVQASFRTHASSFAFALGCYFDAGDPDSLLGGGVNAGAFSTTGLELTLSYSCPEELIERFQYSVEPPNLRFLVPETDGDPATTELVWTLSP